MRKQFPVRITKERGWYVARCGDPPVTSQGRTPRLARANLREAIELYTETWGMRTTDYGKLPRGN